VVKVEEKGSRLVEAKGACIDLSMNAIVVHGSIDVAGMEEFIPVLPECPWISQTHQISLQLDIQRPGEKEEHVH
jgi:hypothetical protein